MKLKLLEIFVCVCETESLTKAAAALGLTQPSVSRSITTLEEHFGGPLLSRTGRGVALTEMGEAALPRVRRLLHEATVLSTDLREFGRSPGGRVSLGILPSMVQPMTGKLFPLLQRQFPRIHLHIMEGYSDQIKEWVATGRADIGVLARYKPRHWQQGEDLVCSRLMLVGPPDCPYSSPEVDFSELAKLPLVLPASPNGLRFLVNETAERLGLNLVVVMDTDCPAATKELVRHHDCYTVLSPEAIWEELCSGSLTATYLVNPELNCRISIITTTYRPFSRAAREVMRAIRCIGNSLDQRSP